MQRKHIAGKISWLHESENELLRLFDKLIKFLVIHTIFLLQEKDTDSFFKIGLTSFTSWLKFSFAFGVNYNKMVIGLKQAYYNVGQFRFIT